MEATTKQMEYIKDLAKEAGKDINEDRVQDLTREQASEIIDGLQRELGNAPTARQRTSGGMNDALFGLAAKLVWQRSLTIGEPPLNDRFRDNVIKTYREIARAKREFSEQLNGASQ